MCHLLWLLRAGGFPAKKFGLRPRLAAATCCALAAGSALLAAVAPARAAFESKNTKIIEWGWDTTGAFAPGSIPANLPAIEQLAFDGVGLDLQKNPPLSGGTGDFFGRNSFGNTLLNTSDYSNSIAALQSSSFNKFTANEMMLFVSPGNVDWFDSTNFAKITANAHTATSVLHSAVGGSTVFLDVEPYQGQVWWYDNFSASKKSAHTYADYQAEVRVRGQQYMDALKSANPDVQIMLTDGYERGNGAGPADENGLVASFIDGLLDHAGTNNTIYDGYEYSYPFHDSSLFEMAYNDMRIGQRSRSANPTAFDAHYRASYGLWLDYNSDGITWSSTNPSINYSTPATFQFAVQQAAMRSDGQVWIYSQQPSWYYPTVPWDNGKVVPQAYKDALANVRRVGRLERFTGAAPDSGAWASHAQGGAVITQNDHLTIAAAGGEADFTTRAVTAAVRDIASIELTPTTAAGSTLLGIALTNDSGTTVDSVLDDSRALFLEWSDSGNGLYAGVSDADGSRLSLIAAGDQPLGHAYLYQIERLSSTSALFSVWDTAGGQLLGTPVTMSFSGMPDALKLSLFAQSGGGSFDNAWIGSPVPEPGAGALMLLGLGVSLRRRKRSRAAS
jgi:hypothetical protein